MKWFTLIFLLVTLYIGNIFYPFISDTVYYLWDKTKDAIFMATVTYLLRRNYDSKYIIRVSQASTAFIIVRIGIEYVVLLIPSLNHPGTLNFLFCLNWAVVMYVFFYDWVTTMFFKIRVWFSVIRFWFKHKHT